MVSDGLYSLTIGQGAVAPGGWRAKNKIHATAVAELRTADPFPTMIHRGQGFKLLTKASGGDSKESLENLMQEHTPVFAMPYAWTAEAVKKLKGGSYRIPDFSSPVELVRGETQASGSGDASGSRMTEASPKPQKAVDIGDEGNFHRRRQP